MKKNGNANLAYSKQILSSAETQRLNSGKQELVIEKTQIANRSLAIVSSANVVIIRRQVESLDGGTTTRGGWDRSFETFKISWFFCR